MRYGRCADEGAFLQRYLNSPRHSREMGLNVSA